jgi:hypothetical protein
LEGEDPGPLLKQRRLEPVSGLGDADEDDEARARPPHTARRPRRPPGRTVHARARQVSLIYRTTEGRRGLAAAGASRFELRALDSLPGTGPVRDLATSEPADPGPARQPGQGAHGGQADRRAPPELVAAVGSGRAGALAILRRALVPEVVTEVPLPGALRAARRAAQSARVARAHLSDASGVDAPAPASTLFDAQRRAAAAPARVAGA